MRSALVLVVLLACKKQESTPASPPTTQPVVADASVADAAAAAAADVDLLHAMPTKLAVSSVVANPAISPFDLVDGELATAWNSKTGQLVGAWIAFRVPPTTAVTAVKLTAGFVSSGPEGDYFTLNPRIKRVAIWHDGIRLREQDLDIESRGLQTVVVGANGGDYKLEVVAVKPGTRKNWREICISELQVIGRPPPGSKRWTGDPEIAIGSLDAAPIGITLSEPASAATLDAYCADFRKRPAKPCASALGCDDKAPSAAECGTEITVPTPFPKLPAGWTARWFATRQAGSRDVFCNLALFANGKVYVIATQADESCGRPVTAYPAGVYSQGQRFESRYKLAVVDLFAGDEPELVLELVELPYGPSSISERLHLCTVTRSGTPACMSTTIGMLETKTITGHGYNEWFEEKWSRDWQISADELVIETGGRKPEEHEIDHADGSHRLRIAD